jgi:CBS domain-containing protein
MNGSNQYLDELLRLPVHTNMKDAPPTVSPIDRVSLVVDMMMKENIGAIVVVEDGSSVGIITERDLLERVIHPKKDFELTLVKDVMSKPPVTIEAGRSVKDALNSMREYDVRRLIITENGSLVGITTERILLEAAYGQYLLKGHGVVTKALHDDANRIGVAYVSTYPPRECGIATYAEDLVGALSRLRVLNPPVVVAINDMNGHYDYGIDVRFQIDREEVESYARAAEYINESTINVVNLQHEYGIFGGQWGEHVLTFLERLEKPVVTTLHTMPEERVQDAKRVLERILEHSDFVIVMARVGIEMLEKLYESFENKIRYIPHGCPNVPFVRTEMPKRRLGLEDRVVLSTFGLLSRAKGIEYAIEALPEVVREDQRILYLIIGETHPEVRKHEGEAYREQLLNQVESLGLRKNVKFVNRFLPRNELIRYLQATDIYIIPYPNREQISSGTLLHALSTGKAIVTTPFLHAKEVIFEGSAMECEFKNANSVADCVMMLLRDRKIRQKFEKKAYEYSRNMIWPNVAMKYVNLFYHAVGR